MNKHGNEATLIELCGGKTLISCCVTDGEGMSLILQPGRADEIDGPVVHKVPVPVRPGPGDVVIMLGSAKHARILIEEIERCIAGMPQEAQT